MTSRAVFFATAFLAAAACSDGGSGSKSDESDEDPDAGSEGGAASGGGGAANGGEDSAGGTQAGSGGAASGGAASGGAGPTLDCSKDKWSNVSDACWSCLCGACKEKLDLCNPDCTKVFECATEKKTLVNVDADIPCEIRATVAECLKDPASQAAANALIAFDTCLIAAPTPSGFRVCDTECAIPYPGDVCERFPAPAM